MQLALGLDRVVEHSKRIGGYRYPPDECNVRRSNDTTAEMKVGFVRIGPVQRRPLDIDALYHRP